MTYRCDVPQHTAFKVSYRHTLRTKPLLLPHDVPPLRVRHHKTPILRRTIRHWCLWIVDTHIHFNPEVLHIRICASHRKHLHRSDLFIKFICKQDCLTSTSWILLAFLPSVFDNVPLTTGSSKQKCRKLKSALISATLLSEGQHTWIIMLCIHCLCYKDGRPLSRSTMVLPSDINNVLWYHYYIIN